jgi:hypothetical protein
MSSTTILLIIVCVLAIMAAMGMVSPWTPITAPILSMLASSALVLVLAALSGVLQIQK